MPHMDWDHPPEVAELRRWQLLVAGRRVIERQGIDGFTIEDVTREARVAKGTFYVYFPSRDEFLDALRVALSDDAFEAVRAAAEGPWDGIFVRMMRAVAEWLAENPANRALFSPAYLAREDRPTRGPLLALLTRVIRDGAEVGVFSPSAIEGAADAIAANALVAYDVLSAGISRTGPSLPEVTPPEVTAGFVERALGFDAARARGRSWMAPLD